MSGAAIVTSPRVQGLVLIGGFSSSNDEYSNAIIELKPNPYEWLFLDQKLQYARLAHLAFTIPDHLTCCRISDKIEINNHFPIFDWTKCHTKTSPELERAMKPFIAPDHWKNPGKKRRKRFETNCLLRRTQDNRDELRTKFNLQSHSPGLVVLTDDLDLKVIEVWKK